MVVLCETTWNMENKIAPDLIFTSQEVCDWVHCTWKLTLVMQKNVFHEEIWTLHALSYDNTSYEICHRDSVCLVPILYHEEINVGWLAESNISPHYGMLCKGLA